MTKLRYCEDCQGPGPTLWSNDGRYLCEDPPRVRRLATTPLREVLRTLAALATLPGFESAEVRLGSEVVDVGADGSVRVRPE